MKLIDRINFKLKSEIPTQNDHKTNPREKPCNWNNKIQILHKQNNNVNKSTQDKIQRVVLQCEGQNAKISKTNRKLIRGKRESNRKRRKKL